ncbi:hypothetical protein Q8F55_002633 [Vanrija albida]|uniref:Nudix hydrolase domain-containing protein n=1 Tax=Vanrija albida TaxID=181172 RepID=A0ABR3QAB5_9TREE
MRRLAAIAAQRRAYSATAAPPRVFTRASLASIAAALDAPNRLPLSALPPHPAGLQTAAKTPRPPREAGVLLPLCNVRGEAHVLMEIRAAGLRTHASEASFPGGKAEETDADLVAAALRETHEELALPPEHVRVLGALREEYSLGNLSRVWPVVGFAASHTGEGLADDAPLPDLDLATLVPEPGEVAAILPLPLAALNDRRRHAPHYFRLDGHKPYWKIRCEDLCEPRLDDQEHLEIWGLSGWFLSRLATRLGWTDTPPVYHADDDSV